MAVTVSVATIALAAVLLPGVAWAQAPAGAMRSVEGQRVALEDLRGQVSVLVFGGMVDPQSPELLPVLQRLADRYSGRVSVYWVSIDPERSGGAVTDKELGDYAGRYGYRGAILRDASGEVFRSVVTSGKRPQVPTIVVIDSSGAPVGRSITGFDRDADLVNQLAAILDRLVAR
jgi:cytochrome oxidase Cu insertion factor (SCO1/SenC/PrrC family)